MLSKSFDDSPNLLLRDCCKAILAKEHYLHNPTAVGAVLRYVVTENDQWLALLVFCSPALHLKPRDQWLRWKPTEVAQRRHLIAQNSRFLVRLKEVDATQLAKSLIGWMKTQDPHTAVWVHFDGKALKGAEPAPAADPKTLEPHVPTEIDPQEQKPSQRYLKFGRGHK